MANKRGKVFGVGYNTLDCVVAKGGVHISQYKLWANMLKRCYGTTESCRNSSYSDVVVCEEWLDFRNFYGWLETVEFRKEGWQLDKDILLKGNRVYGPENCVFLPSRLNGCLLSCKSSRGDLPVGVHFDKSRGKYKATCCNEHGKQWQKRYFTVEEAFIEYKKEKERVIRALAESYKSEIDPRAYNALINYKVEITD